MLGCCDFDFEVLEGTSAQEDLGEGWFFTVDSYRDGRNYAIDPRVLRTSDCTNGLSTMGRMYIRALLFCSAELETQGSVQPVASAKSFSLIPHPLFGRRASRISPEAHLMKRIS